MTTWQHRSGDRYVHITFDVVGNPTDGYRTERYLGTGKWQSIAIAWAEGLRNLHRSDDFSLGVIRDGHLAAILWCREIVDDEPDVIAEIAEELGLTSTDERSEA